MAKKDLIDECDSKGFNSFGTGKIFERRSLRLGRALNILTYLGLAMPLLVGVLLISFQSKWDELKLVVLWAIGLVGLIQALLSLWSLVSSWQSKYSDALYAAKQNARLSTMAADIRNENESVLKSELGVLKKEYAQQEQFDMGQNLSKKETRYGYRSALFQYRVPCGNCKETPETMKPSSCDACGKF